MKKLNVVPQAWFRIGMVVAIALSATASLIWPGRPAFACECVSETTPGENFDGAYAVFSGKVVSVGPGESYTITTQPGVTYTVDSYPPVVTTFEVSRVWKGVVKSIITLAGEETSCDISFSEGEEYLVYASPWYDGRHLSTWLCSGTIRLAYAGPDLGFLGEGHPPLMVTEPAEAATPFLQTGDLIVGAVMLASLLLGAVFIVGWWVRKTRNAE